MTEVWRIGGYSSVVGLPITTQPDPTKNTVNVCVVHGEREEAEARAVLIAAAPLMKAVLLQIKRDNAQYNFGGKLLRTIAPALAALSDTKGT